MIIKTEAVSEGHFYGVDILRGIAAIGIVVCHYFHFFYPNYGDSMVWGKESQPLYDYLGPIYLHGLFFVQFFWVISGFVFAYVYAGKRVTAKSFALRRFARLYPLHFITLFVVAAFQALSIVLNNSTQVIGNFDFPHFLRNIFFLPAGWGYEYSFNSPIWSVNVEVSIYAVFFFLSGICLKWIGAVPFFVALLCVPVAFGGERANLFALCGFYFFIGSWLYCLVTRFKKHLLQLLMFSVVLCYLFFKFLIGIKNWAITPAYFAVPLAFAPPAVILAAIVDVKKIRYSLVRSLRWIGDSTYSLYLWHFPVQVAFLVFLNYYHVDRGIFTSPVSLVVWVAAMLMLSHLSFRCIEKPLQRYIIRRIEGDDQKEVRLQPIRRGE